MCDNFFSAGNFYFLNFFNRFSGLLRAEIRKSQSKLSIETQATNFLKIPNVAAK